MAEEDTNRAKEFYARLLDPEITRAEARWIGFQIMNLIAGETT